MVSDLELTWRSQGHIAFFYLTEMIEFSLTMHGFIGNYISYSLG